ncbi:hypothetical protein ABZ023_18400 [Streptomyces sp. NPDC006367]|uniref:hypothetical protein n=1 Tax=unclassified Streptomyces TaxID=2593676 RepID=UPI0033B14546
MTQLRQLQYVGGPFDGGRAPDDFADRVDMRTPRGCGAYVRQDTEEGVTVYRWVQEGAAAELFAACTPNSYPHEDGRVEHGYQLNVLDQDLTVLTTVELPDWETFDEEAAGRRLADAGFTLRSGPDSASPGGWSPAGLGYMASVARADTGQAP